MQIDMVTGSMKVEDELELVYELLNEMELELKPDGSIYDPEQNTILSFNGMIIKASTNPNQIHYAGQGEIPFNILDNVRLATTLFGHYLKRKEQEGLAVVSHFTEEMAIEGDGNEEDFKVTRLTVRYDINKDIVSPFYRNKCLKYIWMIFFLGETLIDLSNFDVPKEDEHDK